MSLPFTTVAEVTENSEILQQRLDSLTRKQGEWNHLARINSLILLCVSLGDDAKERVFSRWPRRTVYDTLRGAITVLGLASYSQFWEWVKIVDVPVAMALLLSLGSGVAGSTVGDIINQKLERGGDDDGNEVG